MARTRFLLPLTLFALTVFGAACSDAMSDPGPTSKDVSAGGDDGDEPQGSKSPGGSSNGGTGSSSTGGSTATTGGSTGGATTGGGTADGGDGTTGGSTGPIPTGPTTAEVEAKAGPVTFDLGTAVPALAGAKVTANMSVQAGTVGLADLVVTAPQNTGLQLFRPVIVITSTAIDPATGKPKEVTSQIGTNINMQIPAKRVSPLSTPSAAANGLEAGGKVKLRFSALLAASPTSIVGLPNYRECKGVAQFTTWSGNTGTCAGCHGGNFIFPLRNLDAATACGQALRLIDATLNGNNATDMDPGDHPAAPIPAAYRTSLTAWRQAEGVQ